MIKETAWVVKCYPSIPSVFDEPATSVKNNLPVYWLV